MKIAVVICTRNPRPAALARTLEGLRGQTLPADRWELLIVDNGSTDPLRAEKLVAWHPHGRVVREERPGLVSARCAGIDGTRTPLLVFCDDDNVLAPDYLEQCLLIADQHPTLGVWGGAIDGEFEIEPPAHLRPHLHWLALARVDRPRWANFWGNYEAFPAGAGMCLRRELAASYTTTRALPIHRDFDPPDRRKGCGGDVAIILHGHSVGWGSGVFPALKLLHLIPKDRLTTEYFEILREGAGYSETMLRHLYDPGFNPAPVRGRRLFRLVEAYHHWRLPAHERRLRDAYERGRARALAELRAR